MTAAESLIRRIKEPVLAGCDVFQKKKMSVYSGYAALYIIMAIVPFIILIIAVVNLIPGYEAEDVADLLLQILPDLESVKELVISLVTELDEKSSGLLASVAALTTLWSASKGVMAIQKGLDQLDSGGEGSEEKDKESSRIADKGKNYVNKVLKRLSFTLVLIMLFPALLAIRVLGDSAAGMIGTILLVLIALMVILQLFAKLPERRRTLKSQLPGAVLTASGWLVFTELFALFISKSYGYSNVYGTLAAVFLLIMWLRYMIMILFGGGILNRVLERPLS